MAIYRTQVRLTFPIGTGGGTNTWHLRVPSVPSQATDESDVDALMQFVGTFYDSIQSCFPTTYSMSWDGTATEVNVAEPRALAGMDDWTFPGTVSGGYAAAMNMICVTWRTSLAARRGRGRTFLGPIHPSCVQDDGTVSAADLTQVRNAAAALVSSSVAFDDTGAVGVFSQNSDVEGPTFRDVVGSSVTDQIAYLSSRRS